MAAQHPTRFEAALGSVCSACKSGRDLASIRSAATTSSTRRAGAQRYGRPTSSAGLPDRRARVGAAPSSSQPTPAGEAAARRWYSLSRRGGRASSSFRSEVAHAQGILSLRRRDLRGRLRLARPRRLLLHAMLQALRASLGVQRCPARRADDPRRRAPHVVLLLGEGKPGFCNTCLFRQRLQVDGARSGGPRPRRAACAPRRELRRT